MAEKPPWMGEDGEPLDEWTLVLHTPIKDTDGRPITELALSEPTAGAMKAIFAKTGVECDIEAIRQVTQLIPLTIEKLKARDLRAAAAYLRSFFVDGPATGDAS